MSLTVPAAAAPARTDRSFPPPGIRAVVFDVVHTLVEPSPPVAVAYHEAGRRHGLDLDPAVIEPRFRSAWQRQEARDAAASPPFATSRSREADRWRQIVADVFDDAPACEAIFADLWEHFARPTAWRAVPARQAASNFDERLQAIAATVEPLTLADHVFASSELGWRKPAAEFFRAVEERLGLRPAELVLVGDDPDLDIAAARRAGWHARFVGERG